MNGFRESFSSLSHFSDAKGETGFPSKTVDGERKVFSENNFATAHIFPRLKNEVDALLDIREMRRRRG